MRRGIMPDKREIDALIERAIRSGAEVTIVTIGGRGPAGSADQAQPEAAVEPAGPVSDPILILDPDGGAILESNTAFRAWSGLSGSAPAEGLVRVDPEGRIVALARRALETGEPASGRIALQGRAALSAVAVPISGGGRPLVQVILRTAPFLGAAESELHRALRRLAEILDALPTPLLTLDRSGRIRSANPAAELLLSRGPELVGLEVEAVAAPLSAQRLRELVAAAAASSQPQAVEIALTVSQEAVPAQITIVGAGEGEDLVLIAVLRDLRPEREAELARAQLLGRQHQMQKLEAIGRLAGGIAADVNNILASILGYADLAMDDLPPGSKGRDSVEQVLKAGRRGKALVRQIVALGRGEPRPERRIRLDELLRTTLEVLRPIVPEQITLETRVTAPTAAVMGDAAELHQVLLNLCRNAVQAIGSREGRIEVVLEAVEVTPGFAERPVSPEEDATILAARPEEEAVASARPARIFTGRLEPGPYVRITVTDTGEGMAPAVLSRVFEPFFTTRKLGEASGLGLAVVHGIVSAQGGAILASSTSGQGTRMEVYLPRSHRATELMAEAVDRDQAGPGVLLAGSAVEEVAPIRRVLEAAGLSVETVLGGRAALETFRADHGRWRMAVLADTLEDVAAESLSLEMSRIRPDLPIILCAEVGKTLTLDRLRAAGVTETVPMPVDPGELAIAVERALRIGARRV
jgi:signal transduction histidine kinase/CheY-like chemotaxis protein